MKDFWLGFEKRAEETSNPITPRQTNFMDNWGIPSKKNRTTERGLDYEDNYSTTGAFGY
jgi:hypothetical protein